MLKSDSIGLLESDFFIRLVVFLGLRLRSKTTDSATLVTSLGL